MIPEGEVKLAPHSRPPLPASDDAGPHSQQAWLSQDAPYDRMTGMVRLPILLIRANNCASPCDDVVSTAFALSHSAGGECTRGS